MYDGGEPDERSGADPAALGVSSSYGVHTFYWWLVPCGSVETSVL
jgi:hypothetical protein